MMHKFLPFLLLILLANCKSKDKDTAPSISFGGITATNTTGDKLSDDLTDWKINDTWTASEASMFNGQYSTVCTPSFNYSIIAYPNPAVNAFAIALQMPGSAHVEMRLVDRNNKVLISNDYVQGALYLNTSSLGVKDTVRLYYRFVENGCEFRGHGDIVLK